MKREVTAEEYYDPCLKSYSSVNNKAARRIYFEETEPDDERPTHSKVLHTAKSEALLNLFVSRLIVAVGLNAIKSWRRGTPLPNPNSFVQPLSDQEQ